MKLLRYVAKAYVAAILLTLLGLVILVVAAGLVEGSGHWSGSEAPALTALRLAGYRAVQFSYQVLPAAACLGALVAGTGLARRGELLAIQAAGISSRAVWGTFCAVALGAAVVAGLMGQYAVPRAIAGIERTQREDLGAADPLGRFYSQRSHWFHKGELVLYLPAVDAAQQTFPDPVVYRRHDGLLEQVIDADLLHHTSQGWFLDHVERLTVTPPSFEKLAHLRLDLDVPPQDIIDIAGDPREMGFSQIVGLIARRRAARLDTANQRLVLHSRLTQPFLVLLMLLVVVPWALHPDRRRSLALNLGAGVVVIAVFFSVSYLFRLLALGHHLPVPLGAWGSVLACVAALPVSFAAYRRVRVRGSLW